MKKNEKRCTLHISFEKVMAMFTKLNEVYVAIHKLVKVHLAKIVLKNHRHAYVEADCHLSTLHEKNDHIDPKIKKPDNDLCTHKCMLFIKNSPRNNKWRSYLMVTRQLSITLCHV
jgi:hypothetical protein